MDNDKDTAKKSDEMSDNYITNNNITMNSLMNIKEEIKQKSADLDVTSDLSSADTEHELEQQIEDKQSVISDTDSALSSINTIESIKSEPLNNSIDNNLYIGKIVWASFSKSSWYPCIIYSLENCSSSKLKFYF